MSEERLSLKKAKQTINLAVNSKGDVTKSTTDWMDEKGQIYRREVIKEDGTKFSITENSRGNRWEKSTYSDGSEMLEHFDMNGTLTSRETTRPDGTIFSETYSPDGKLIEKTEQNGKLFKVYQPDKEGNLQISLVLDGAIDCTIRSTRTLGLFCQIMIVR